MAVRNGTSKGSRPRTAKGAVTLWLGLAAFAWVGALGAQQPPLVPLEDLQPMESSQPEAAKPEPPKASAPKVESPDTAQPEVVPPSDNTAETTERPVAPLIINLGDDIDGKAAPPQPTTAPAAAPPATPPAPEPVAPAPPKVVAPATPVATPPAPVSQPVTPPPAATPPAAKAPPATRPGAGLPTAPVTTTPGVPVWVWIVVGVVAAGLIAGLVFWLVSKRKPAAKDKAGKPRKQREKKGGAAAAPRSTPGRRPAVLRDLSNATGVAEHKILADTVQIGRASAQSTDIQSIVVKMNTVGRRHAVIEYRHHTYWLVDQGSLNGTFLNGERIHRERALNNGARIQLESAEFEFTIPEAPVLDATAAVDPGEFIETLVASEDQAQAMAAAAQAARDKHAAETVVEQRPPAQKPPAQEPAAQKPAAAKPAARESAARQPSAPEPSARKPSALSPEEAKSIREGAETVDFDVFGDDPNSKPER